MITTIPQALLSLDIVILLVAYSRGIPREFPGNGEVLAISAGTPSPKRSRDSKGIHSEPVSPTN